MVKLQVASIFLCRAKATSLLINTSQNILKKSFRRSGNKTLRTYLNGLPNKGGNAFTLLNFVPQHIPVSRLQIRQGLNHKDIFNVCLKYPDLCLKNPADATENPAEIFPTIQFAEICWTAISTNLKT